MKDFIEEYIQINDIKQYFLHYPAQSDIVVLFLHGGPGQSESHYAYKTKPSHQNYNLVHYDQRGTGKTQSKNKTKPQDVTLENLLDDLRVTIEYIKKRYTNSKVVLLGHSWGSILGIEYIKRYSDTVSAFIGMGQVVNFLNGEKAAFDYCSEIVKRNEDKRDIKQLELLSDYPFSADQENIFKTIMHFRKIQMKYKLVGYCGGSRKMRSHLMKSPTFVLKDIPILLTSMKTNNNLVNCLFRYDTSNYTKFNVPIYFICGRNDWQVPSVLVDTYYSSIEAPDKAFHWIENAGHLADIDNPDGFNQSLWAICQRL